MNRVALVTGASSGIGLAFCKEYARQGYHVILVSRFEDKLKKVAKYLEKNHNIRTTIIVKDLAVKNSALELLDEVRKGGFSIDVLVNNAGINNSGKFLDIPLKKIQQEISLNMLSLTNLTYLFLNEMLKKQTGIIINVASIASFFPTPYEGVYGATKAYVLSLTESLNYEYGNKGIKIFAICPGYTKTNLYADAQIDLGKARIPEQVVNTTLKALEKGKHFSVDGLGNVIQSKFPRLFSRKFVLKITGNEGKKTLSSK